MIDSSKKLSFLDQVKKIVGSSILIIGYSFMWALLINLFAPGLGWKTVLIGCACYFLFEEITSKVKEIVEVGNK